MNTLSSNPALFSLLGFVAASQLIGVVLIIN